MTDSSDKTQLVLLDGNLVSRSKRKQNGKVMVRIFSFEVEVLDGDVPRTERDHSRRKKFGNEGWTRIGLVADNKREIPFARNTFEFGQTMRGEGEICQH
jgi:hypothetical protein